MSEVFKARVKPLVWREVATVDYWSAKGIRSTYTVTMVRGVWTWNRWDIGTTAAQTHKAESRIDAMTQCQADHDARVKALLDIEEEPKS